MADPGETDKPAEPAGEAAAAAEPAVPAAVPKKPAAKKPEGPLPREAWDDPIAAGAKEKFGASLTKAVEYQKELTLTVAKADVIGLLTHLKQDEAFNYLVDITAVDFDDREPRFDIVYHVYSHEKNRRVRIKTAVGDGDEAPTATGLWKAANWPEREVWDMFGVIFTDHPNLERILLWEGFNGHPLRKDFPVQGIDTGAAIYDDIPPSAN